MNNSLTTISQTPPPPILPKVTFRSSNTTNDLASFSDITNLPSVLKQVKASHEKCHDACGVGNEENDENYNGGDKKGAPSVMTVLANKMSALSLVGEDKRRLGNVVSRLEFGGDGGDDKENVEGEDDRECEDGVRGSGGVGADMHVSPNEKEFGLKQAYLEAKTQLKFAKIESRDEEGSEEKGGESGNDEESETTDGSHEIPVAPPVTPADYEEVDCDEEIMHVKPGAIQRQDSEDTHQNAKLNDKLLASSDASQSDHEEQEPEMKEGNDHILEELERSAEVQEPNETKSTPDSDDAHQGAEMNKKLPDSCDAPQNEHPEQDSEMQDRSDQNLEALERSVQLQEPNETQNIPDSDDTHHNAGINDKLPDPDDTLQRNHEEQDSGMQDDSDQNLESLEQSAEVQDPKETQNIPETTNVNSNQAENVSSQAPQLPSIPSQASICEPSTEPDEITQSVTAKPGTTEAIHADSNSPVHDDAKDEDKHEEKISPVPQKQEDEPSGEEDVASETPEKSSTQNLTETLSPPPLEEQGTNEEKDGIMSEEISQNNEDVEPAPLKGETHLQPEERDTNEDSNNKADDALRAEPSEKVAEWINVLNGRKNRLNWQERRQALSAIKAAIDGDSESTIPVSQALSALTFDEQKLTSALQFHLNELRPSIVLKTLELILSILKANVTCKTSLGMQLFPQIAELACGHTSSSMLAAVCVAFLVTADPTLCDTLAEMDDVTSLRDMLEELADDDERPNAERSNARSARVHINKAFQVFDAAKDTSSVSQSSQTAHSTSELHSQKPPRQSVSQSNTNNATSFRSHTAGTASQRSRKQSTSSSLFSGTISSIRKDKKLAAPRSHDEYSDFRSGTSGATGARSSYSSVSGSETSRAVSNSSRAKGLYTLDDLEKARREGVAQGVAEANTVNQVKNEQMIEELETCKQDKQELLNSLKSKDTEIKDINNCFKQLQERYRQAKHAIGLYEDKEVFLMKQNNVLKKDYASLEKWSKDLKASAERKLATSLKNVQRLTEAYETLKTAKGGSGVLDKVLEEENRSLKARAFDDMEKLQSLKTSIRDKDKLLAEKTAELEHKVKKCSELERLCEEVLAASDKKMLQ